LKNLLKGKALENAVSTIERFILLHTPEFTQSDIKFYKNKIFIIDGVKHEVDLYVEINPNTQYSSFFLFECKNWKKPIGKNEVISFSEKIKKIKAQKGIFVAKSFSKFAIAQAILDPRMELVNFSNDLDISQFPPGIHFTYTYKEKNISGLFDFESKSKAKKTKLDTNSSNISYNQTKESLKAFLQKYAKMVVDGTIHRNENKLSEGDNKLSGAREFICDAIIDGDLKVEKVLVKVDFTVFYKILPITSQYTIEKRGRIYHYEKPPTLDDINIEMSFISAELNR